MSAIQPLGAFFELIDGAVAVLRGDGTIVAASRCFEQLTGSGEILRLDKRRTLVFRDPAVHASFKQGLSDARAATGSAEPLVFAVGRRPLPLTAILRFLCDTDGAGPCLLLVMCGTEKWNTVTDDLLRLHYQLSAAEAAVVRRLAGGQKVGAVARSLGVTVTTARNQLQSAMGKMNVNRQAEVVNAVACLAPSLRLGTHPNSGSG